MRHLGRRLVLVPQSTGTPRSVQDRSDFTATVVDESTVGIHNDSIMESVEAVGIGAEDGVANRRPRRAQASRRLVLVSQPHPQEVEPTRATMAGPAQHATTGDGCGRSG